MASQDISELIAILKQFRDELPQVLPAVATSVSMTGKALAERTIKDRGFGKEYSRVEVPAYWFYGKWINNRGRDFLYSNKGDTGSKKKVEDITEKDLINGTTTWGKFRNAQGLQDKYVDLTYSGKMWAGMFPQEVEVNLFMYTAPLGNNTIEGQNKMNWNYARYGDYIGDVLQGDNFDLMQQVGYDEFIRIMDAKLGWKKD